MTLLAFEPSRDGIGIHHAPPFRRATPLLSRGCWVAAYSHDTSGLTAGHLPNRKELVRCP